MLLTNQVKGSGSWAEKGTSPPREPETALFGNSPPPLSLNAFRTTPPGRGAWFPGLGDAMKKKVTRREQFLAEMDAVAWWTRLSALITPHYPTAGPKGGRPPMALERMLRAHLSPELVCTERPDGPGNHLRKNATITFSLIRPSSRCPQVAGRK